MVVRVLGGVSAGGMDGRDGEGSDVCVCGGGCGGVGFGVVAGLVVVQIRRRKEERVVVLGNGSYETAHTYGHTFLPTFLFPLSHSNRPLGMG